MLQEISRWIEHTSVSKVIANADWIIPAFQTVHILAIAVVISTMGMLDLRLMGFTGMRYPLRAMVDRYEPWMWISVLVLLCTGAVLIIGEPERSLGNWVFQVKMGLLASVLLLTVVFKQLLRRQVDAWERPQWAAKLTGLVSLLLWIGLASSARASHSSTAPSCPEEANELPALCHATASTPPWWRPITCAGPGAATGSSSTAPSPPASTMLRPSLDQAASTG